MRQHLPLGSRLALLLFTSGTAQHAHCCPPARPAPPCHITDFHTADQMCLWCYHHILEEAAKASLDARCPNCRSSYDEEKIQMQHIDAEQ